MRADGYFHANNVHVNALNNFSQLQVCDGGTDGTLDNPTRMEFVNNLYSKGNISGTQNFIIAHGNLDCITFQLWEDGTRVIDENQSLQDCTNHGCTFGFRGGQLVSSSIAAIDPTGYVSEVIGPTQQDLVDFATKIGSYAGARPLSRFSYVQTKINQSINSIDGTGPESSYSKATTIASEGGIGVLTPAPISGYEPTSAGDNPCAENMPTGAAADAIQSSGLTRLHEWVIGCFYDNVMPAGYREDKLQNYGPPTGGGNGPPVARPNPPMIQDIS